MVMDDQRAAAAQGRWRRRQPCMRIHRPAALDRSPEGAAAAWFAFKLHRAAHELGQPPGDRQAEAGAARAAVH